jgi:serine/threonine protein phosphatase PrpC
MLSSIQQELGWAENQIHDFSSGANSVFLNRYVRSLRCPESLGASVFNGSAGLSLATGMGDCLYLDFSSGFFAVADGSDRNTSASREFMGMFSRMLAGKLFLSFRKCYDAGEIVALKEQLVTEAEKLLVEFSFRDSCTFTGVMFLRTISGIIAVILHTGDSVLISCNLRDKTAQLLTKSNFWMVGRSQHFFQVEEMSVDEDDRLLLATDGLRDIPAKPGISHEKLILQLFAECGPEDIPDRLSSMRRIVSHGCDDLAIIAINPYFLPDSYGRFIIGGTSTNEERVFQDEKKRGVYPDEYLLYTPEKNCDEFVF